MRWHTGVQKQMSRLYIFWMVFFIQLLWTETDTKHHKCIINIVPTCYFPTLLIPYDSLLWENKPQFKGHLLFPFLQDVIQVSGVPRMCLWSFSSKYPTKHLLYHFEYAYFEWKQKRCFRACLFKCKWAAAPHPLFQNRVVPLQLIHQILC